MPDISATTLAAQGVSRECLAPKVVTVPLDFTATQDYSLSLNTLYDNGLFNALLSMYVDNRLGTARIDVTISGTQFQFSCPAGQQGFFTVLAPSGAPTITFNSAGNAAATAWLMNFEVAGNVWTPGT